MESQTLDSLDVARIEKSVEEAVTKIDSLNEFLQQVGSTQWPNPLPEIRDQLSVGVTALNQIRSAHRSALENANIQENTVRQQNDFERSRLSDKQAELEKKENELRERERELDMREGGQNARDEALGTRSRDLDALRSNINEGANSLLAGKGQLAAREDNLKTAEAEVEEQKKAWSEKHDEQLTEGTRLEGERAQLNADKATAEAEMTRRVTNLVKQEDQLKADQGTARQLTEIHAGRIAKAAKELETKISNSNTAASSLGSSLESAQGTATDLENKLGEQSSALDKQSAALDADAGKLSRQSTSVDTISQKLSGLDLDAVDQKLAQLKAKADGLLEDLANIGTEVMTVSDNARSATTAVSELQSEHVSRLDSSLADIAAKALELRERLQMPAREPESGTPGTPAPATSAPATPASDKRKRELAYQRSLKRVSQGLEQPSGDGRPMSSESAEFGPALAQGAKTSEGSIPGSPAPAPTPQPLPQWVTQPVAAEIQGIWSRFEFSRPQTWTQSLVDQFKNTLVTYEKKDNAQTKPSRILERCAAEQAKGNETCFVVKCQRTSSTFDDVNRPCSDCREKRRPRPCLRITEAPNGKLLVALREQSE